MTKVADAALDIADLKRVAQRRLPRGMYEFVERGTEDDQAIRNNPAAFERLALRPRVLRDVSKRDLKIKMFGKEFPTPIFVAPTGVAGLIWHDGERAIARAAGKLGLPFCLSTASMTAMEEVAASTTAPLWFQLYMFPDFDVSRALIERARTAGFDTLIITVDSAVPSNREYNRRNGFGVPFRVNAKNFVDIATHPQWLLSVVARYVMTTGMPTFENYPEQYRTSVTGQKGGKLSLPRMDSLTWDDLKRLRALWDGPLIVKGVLHPDDARMASNLGADAIVVSNHGGRNLDYSMPPLMALSPIADALKGRTPVILDGGIRRGSDVIKALALGADAVMTGRAPLWGLAADGEDGAHRALTLLIEEMSRVMASMGCAKIADIEPDMVTERAFDLTQRPASASTNSRQLNVV